MKAENTTKLQFDSLSVNESYARGAAAAFLARYDPTVPQLADIKTAVSEAVTNCIVHAYKNEPDEKKKRIYIEASYDEIGIFTVTIKDKGCGIPDVKKAMEPLYTTDAESERSGMGFSIMETFTDRLRVRSNTGRGTSVTMIKRLSPKKGL